jgi:transposase
VVSFRSVTASVEVRWTWDGTLERIHQVLYLKWREQAERDVSPTAAIIDSQSVKSAEKAGPRLMRLAAMQERKSLANI